MNFSEMTPKQLGWYISDTCELERLGAFIESRLNELQALKLKCREQEKQLSVLDGYRRSFVMHLKDGVND